MPFASLGTNLEFEYDIAGQGETVVLVSGLGVHRSVWCDVADALKLDFEVLTYDLRGYSGVCPSLEFTIEDLAGDLIGLLDRLGRDAVHLVGHSQGGFIALEAALARPGLVSSLVVAGSASYTDEYGRRVLRSWRDALLQQGQKAFFKNLLLWQYSVDYFNERTRELDVLGKWLSRAPMKVENYLAHNLACETHETRDRLGLLRMPTLLLGGAEDRVMGLRHNRLLKELISDAQIVTLDRLAHDLFVESPERTIPVVADFLRRLVLRQRARA